MANNQNDFDAKNAIKEVADANDGVAFDNKLKASICRSADVQKEIKGLVWQAVKDKFLWFVGALILLLASNFLIGMAQTWGSYLVTK